MKVYIAIQEALDENDSCEIIAVNENREIVDSIVLDYFGINPNKKYINPAEYLGFTKSDYDDFDDFVGIYKFKDEDRLETVKLYHKKVN